MFPPREVEARQDNANRSLFFAATVAGSARHLWLNGALPGWSVQAEFPFSAVQHDKKPIV